MISILKSWKLKLSIKTNIHNCIVGYLNEWINNHSSSRTIKHIYWRCLQPGIKVTYWQGDILCITLHKKKNSENQGALYLKIATEWHSRLQISKNLIKEPNFTISSWLRYTMSIIMEKNSLRLGIFATCITKFLHFLNCRIKLNLVACLKKHCQPTLNINLKQ